MELKQLHILFTTRWMGMARAVVALDRETGEPLEAVLTPWVAGGGKTEKINACRPITWENVHRLAEKADSVDPTAFEALAHENTP